MRDEVIGMFGEEYFIHLGLFLTCIDPKFLKAAENALRLVMTFLQDFHLFNSCACVF